MTFTKRLREGVREGRITCSVRIWTRPHVIAGNRYRMDEGEIEIDSITSIGLPDITPELARDQVSWVWLICSKLQSTARARGFISSGFATFLRGGRAKNR
jgi:hypothetical protein